MAENNMPAGGSPDNPTCFDLLNEAHVELGNAQTLLAMAGDRMGGQRPRDRGLLALLSAGDGQAS
jgi:hypothetical protein